MNEHQQHDLRRQQTENLQHRKKIHKYNLQKQNMLWVDTSDCIETIREQIRIERQTTDMKVQYQVHDHTKTSFIYYG